MEPDDVLQALNSIWIFVNAVLILWMQVGFALLEVGHVRAHHINNLLVKNVIDGAISAIMFWSVGFALYSASGNAFIGVEHFFLSNVSDDSSLTLKWLLLLAFGTTSVTIVSGAVAERCKLPAYYAFAAVMSGFAFPVVAHWTWTQEGWMSPWNEEARVFGGNVLGFMDYSGGTVVHALGGVAALAAIWQLGPREGRFGVTGDPVEMRGAVGNSSVYKTIGTMILFASFVAFNGASVGHVQRAHLSGKIGANTVIASAASCFSVMLVKTAIHGYNTDIAHSIGGLLAGCVSITAGSALVEPWAAFVIGAVGGVVYERTEVLLLRMLLDDVVNAVPVHLTPGLWGTVAVAFFATDHNIRAAYSLDEDVQFDGGILYGGSGRQLGMQILGAAVIVAWSAAIFVPLFCLLSWLKVLRIPSDVQLSMHRATYGGTGDASPAPGVASTWQPGALRKSIEQPPMLPALPRDMEPLPSTTGLSRGIAPAEAAAPLRRSSPHGASLRQAPALLPCPAMFTRVCRPCDSAPAGIGLHVASADHPAAMPAAPAPVP